jgi:hypothetical protein
MLLTMALAAFLIYRSVIFRVVSTDPPVDSVATISPYFRINFNKELSQDISVSLEPASTSYTSKIEGSSISLLFNDILPENQKYEVKISNISSTNGKRLSDKSFVFTTKIISSKKLSIGQRKLLDENQERYKEKIFDDPLVKLLPFRGGGNEFQISYTVNTVNQNPQLVIVIASNTPKGQEDALNWIRLVGFDPADYKISYVDTGASAE